MTFKILIAAGCSDADVASANLSKAADQFEVTRRIVFYNGITGEYMLSIEGLCSLGNHDKARELSVTCKTGPGSYKKHFLGLSDNVTFFVEQVGAMAIIESSGSINRVPTIGMSGAVDAYAAALAAAPMLNGLTESVAAMLKDPAAVHVAMLRGEIAKPAIRDLLHAYGADALAQYDRGANDETASVAGLVKCPACKGMNCGATDAVSHSPECLAEHEALIDAGRLDTPGNRNPDDRYDGYKGRPLRANATADQAAAHAEGARAVVGEVPAEPSAAVPPPHAKSVLAARCETAIDSIEAMLGGRNGPSIQLRAWVRELSTVDGGPPARDARADTAIIRAARNIQHSLFHDGPGDAVLALRDQLLPLLAGALEDCGYLPDLKRVALDAQAEPLAVGFFDEVPLSAQRLHELWKESDHALDGQHDWMSQLAWRVASFTSRVMKEVAARDARLSLTKEAANWVRDGIANFAADNWPDRKHTLAEIEAGIRAIEINPPAAATPGSSK